jgi:methylated-DNA-protein-cysteine methyltransferase-like protein
MKYTSPPNRNEYYQAVWDLVRQIPPGQVATYGQIAALLADPEDPDSRDYAAWAPRWVGGAMAACPADVPWQRVINSQGKISLRPGSGQSRQKELLEEEGVEFDDRDRIDLHEYSWRGPGQDRDEPQQLSFNHMIDGES